MKMQKNRKDTVTRHEFQLAGHTAIIRADEYFYKAGLIATEIQVNGCAPVKGCFIGVLLKKEARRRMKEIRGERYLGIERPEVTEGDVVDVGFPNFERSIQALCGQTGLNPNDCTDYDYVELTVRGAALGLARDIVLKHSRRKTPAISRRRAKIFDPFEL